jgi:hypothetical protein
MTAHRYWRVYVTAQAGGAGGNISISELSMAASTGGANLCTGSGVSVDSTVVGPATNLFDGNSNTFWANNAELPGWVAYDFGAGNAYAIVEVKITPRNDGYYAQAPQTWQLQWSDDGSTWTSAALFTAGAWTAGSPQTFDVPTPATNRFWRIYVTTVQSGTQLAVAEFSMASTLGGANLCTAGANVIASSVLNSGYAAAYAIDGNPSTEWAPVGGLPAWWAYDFGAAGGPSIREVKITARNDYYYGQAPTDWELQVSTDFVTWTTVQSFTAATWTNGQQQTFDVPAAAPAAYMPPVMF